MGQASHLNLMEDRQIDLSGIPDSIIKDNELEFLLDDEYIVPEGIFLYQDEVDAFKQANEATYQMFEEELLSIVKSRDFNFLKLPSQMIDLIIHSVENKHKHLIGRFDFSGGINGIPIKLLEFNADMPTLLPESITIQDGFNSIMNGEPFSELKWRLEVVFNKLFNSNENLSNTILGSSFGNAEDVANLDLLLQTAHAEGFETYYADLPEITFSKNEGVFVEDENGGYVRFDYFLKLVPWEFISFEEPGLLDDLHNLILNGLVHVLNPAYTIVFQSKAFLARLAEKYNSEYLLKTTNNQRDFRGMKHVRKAAFGRLGENITIYGKTGSVIEQTEGNLDLSHCIYQEFADLYKDDYGEYYQPGVYNILGSAAGISFRRADRLIVNNDCQFIPHIVK